MEVLNNLRHRGAAGSDPETGDGAGVLIQMPHEFMRLKASEVGIKLPASLEYGVGVFFLPQDATARAAACTLIESVIREEGQAVLGWRDVPRDNTAIGAGARTAEPHISHLFVGRSSEISDAEVFERTLYIIRKVIEKRAAEAGFTPNDVYAPSLSCNTIVYKGLLHAPQIPGYYLDLADETMVSSFALVHSRFSTNTLGSWRLAHPYRFVAHNGEINTLRGNLNWMTARQSMFSSPLFGDDMSKLFPIITPNQSDTASIDNAIELLLRTGRSLPHVMTMMIPEAWSETLPMPPEKRAYYEYHSALMEPWDGPALIAFTDGTRIGAILDRNGLRPFRYLVTKDDLLVMASEAGVLDVPPEDVRFKERLHPGRMFLVDPDEGRIIDDAEIKRGLAGMQPYADWIDQSRMTLDDLPELSGWAGTDDETLLERQRSFGYTWEDVNRLMTPMAVTSQEPDGSMGNDTPPAVLSDHAQPLFDYFKQLFAQVSNPPLDAIREEMVTSLEAFVGAEQNLFEETPEHVRQLRLLQPILTNHDLEKIRQNPLDGICPATLSTVFHAREEGALQRALDELCERASAAVATGCSILILSDRDIGPDYAPIPSLLATAAVHHHLIREGTRMKVGLIVESGEPRQVPHFALLIGYGAAAVNPYLAFETIDSLRRQGLLTEGDIDEKTAEKNYIKAVDKGILKIMSKMGIATIQSYRGAQIFEAVGLGQELIDRFFAWTPSQIAGVGLEHLEQDANRWHARAYPEVHVQGDDELDLGGKYHWRRGGEFHMYNPDTIATLQHAVRTGSYQTFLKFARLIDVQEKELSTFRGLLDFLPAEQPISIDQVEPASEIVKRFASGAISLGAISREAHETLAIAANRIGAKSNTGEGGEDYNRYVLDENGDSRNSAIKQVASGRFGVTANYLAHADDLQIKMAQGSKPGEGGRLPGYKVDEYIGWVRRTTPGVELISPPPHHDIYSIEDLAQLIHDLKNANPDARIHVKLVSEVGVGTIAAGVAKGHGDVVLISGDSGGTGASPESSIKFAGLPWELGLAETQQVLVANDLRSRIVVQTDGQLKTGRDVAIACLLGAEEFGFATAALVSLGCIMLRKCHLNACSVGIATQDPELRKQFAGEPEHVINYFMFVAEQLRGIMAEMGFRTINEMVGRVDRVEARQAIDHWKAQGLDFGALLTRPDVPDSVGTYQSIKQDHGLDKALDLRLIELAQGAIDGNTPVKIELPIANSNRTVGTMLSNLIARRFGEDGLPDGAIEVAFRGSAGQSFGSFLVNGVKFRVEGDTNDYLAKGLSGGRIVVVPDRKATFVPEENTIVGNTVLYGATRGEVFIRGIAGERFAVRNSGAHTVVEGVGDHGCEYMTGGVVVVLGLTGRNFAAGMSGGEAYVLDENGTFAANCNPGMVDLDPVETDEDIATLRGLVEQHLESTGSANARRVLADWPNALAKFVKVAPVDYKRIIRERASRAGERDLAAVPGG